MHSGFSKEHVPSFRNTGNEVYGAGLGSPKASTFNLIHVGRADQTGIAIQNIDPTNTVNVEVHYVSDGQVTGSDSLSIPGGGRESMFAYEYFTPSSSQGIEAEGAHPQEVLRSSSGYVVIISNRDVTVISLLTRDQLPFASLPAGTP